MKVKLVSKERGPGPGGPKSKQRNTRDQSKVISQKGGTEYEYGRLVLCRKPVRATKAWRRRRTNPWGKVVNPSPRGGRPGRQHQPRPTTREAQWGSVDEWTNGRGQGLDRQCRGCGVESVREPVGGLNMCGCTRPWLWVCTCERDVWTVGGIGEPLQPRPSSYDFTGGETEWGKAG